MSVLGVCFPYTTIVCDVVMAETFDSVRLFVIIRDSGSVCVNH